MLIYPKVIVTKKHLTMAFRSGLLEAGDDVTSLTYQQKHGGYTKNRVEANKSSSASRGNGCQILMYHVNLDS